MNARLQHRVTPSRVSPARSKIRKESPSQFDHVRLALDNYLAKAADARKHLLEHPYDPKLLHAWRVGLRRVTATLKDVAALSDDDLDDVQRYLRVCREATGSCRDLDILAQETLPAFLEGERAGKAAPLAEAVAAQQLEAHRLAVIALKKHSLAVPLQSWRHWAQVLEPPGDAKVHHVAAAAIEQRFAALKKRASRLDGSQKRLHKLRSATKRLRYTIELYQHAFPKQGPSAWLKRLAELQADLGLAHDRMMGRKLITGMVDVNSPKGALKPFRRWSKQTAYDATHKATQSLAKVQELRPYWRKHAH
ncbi:CHAD domain-containing protein [Dyella sp. C9]|uniref:CHAD domain-containing protein n=1 Tax=Dyella sp. C9 TaxID=2202154 RepID=UPI000DEEE7DE|nr:CHAD domain-containing protein [Dyella sp. C9]